jgi:hypothetical protein
VQNFLATLRGYYRQQTGDPSGAQMMALQSLADVRQQQALALSYFDCFWLFAVVALLLLPLVLLMRRSVAEKERTSGRSEGGRAAQSPRRPPGAKSKGSSDHNLENAHGRGNAWGLELHCARVT